MAFLAMGSPLEEGANDPARDRRRDIVSLVGGVWAMRHISQGESRVRSQSLACVQRVQAWVVAKKASTGCLGII